MFVEWVEQVFGIIVIVYLDIWCCFDIGIYCVGKGVVGGYVVVNQYVLIDGIGWKFNFRGGKEN